MEKIVSCVRIRPRASITCKEEDICATKKDSKTVLLTKTQTSLDEFVYDQVFGDEANNSNIFDNLVGPLIEKALQGYNLCIFTNGQTSSGKTFTMKGNESDPGIIPLTLQKLFSRISEGHSELEPPLITLDYVEIYNETINDLLKRGNTNLDLKLDASKGLIIKGLTKHEVSSFEDSLRYL